MNEARVSGFLSSSRFLRLWCGLQEWLGDLVQGHGEQRQSHLGDHEERLRGHGEKTVIALKPGPPAACINQLSSQRKAQVSTATGWRQKFLFASNYPQRFAHVLFFKCDELRRSSKYWWSTGSLLSCLCLFWVGALNVIEQREAL